MKLRFGTLEHLRTFKPSGGLLLALGFAACGQEAAVKEDVIAQESTPAIISSGTYQIVSRSSGKALGVDGAGVVQSEYTGNSSQQWKVTSEAGGAYKIQNLNSSKFLDVDVSVSGGLNDGAKVQQWKLIPVTTPPTPPVSPPVSLPPTPPTPPPSVTADFYVSPTGDDANAGSNAKRFRTIQRATGSIKAGQTVLVRL